jgi:hypothetical protein
MQSLEKSWPAGAPVPESERKTAFGALAALADDASIDVDRLKSRIDLCSRYSFLGRRAGPQPTGSNGSPQGSA